ncbi:MAG: hypothetical protein IKR18_03725 [Bacteroidaceae bacterium]|nr:hypothetical protein [Bacteroidaceae bacterium]
MKTKYLLTIILLATTILSTYAQKLTQKELQRMDSIATARFLAGQYSSALDIAGRTIELIEKAQEPAFDSIYVRSMLIAGKCYFRAEKHEQAADMAKKYTDYYGSHVSNSDTLYASYADNASLYLIAANRSDEAADYNAKAIAIFRGTAPKSRDLAIAYIHGAEICGETNPERAITLQQRALDIIAQLDSRYTDNYCDELKYLKRYYDNAKKTKEANDIENRITWLEQGRLPLSAFVKDADEARMRKEEALYCSRYILNHRINANGMNDALNFISTWATKSDEVTIDLGRFLAKSFKSTSDAFYLAVYFAAASNYLITNNQRYMDYTAYESAVIGMLNFYMNSRDILKKKNDNLEKYIKTYEQDKDSFFKLISDDYSDLQKNIEKEGRNEKNKL